MSVKSAQRVLEIFELLIEYPGGLNVKEISESLSFPQSSTFTLVKTLHEAGYVTQDMQKRYKLGPKLIHLGTSAMDSLDIHTEGLPHLQELMRRGEETVFMAVLSVDELVYVAKIDNNRSIRTSAQPGYRKPLYCTGLGKAFLAFIPHEEQVKLLEHIELLPITENTITDKTVLKKQLTEFRKQGYSIDDEENEEGLYCLAAPVYGPMGDVRAAISMAGPKNRMQHRKDKLAEDLLYTAEKISESIGYFPKSR
ncbi:IclR family transcriptional regulator [Metabacillus sp. RGM 3146]|uniref:IclR family transcriptional regulator n=1 Tax=Metabacillus sp. RGM 3146 TaxID=3401092 RepID=UPI003B9A8DC6